MSLYVYIAGPYTGGDVARNVATAIEVGHIVLDAGHCPYVPHLSHFLHLQRARPYEEWMSLDLAWLRKCDGLVRLPGDSPGADREEAEADRLRREILRLPPGLSRRGRARVVSEWLDMVGEQ